MPHLAPPQPAAGPHLAQADAPPPQPAIQWDVFCRVIDNHGDLGVCWRLACHLAALGSAVRLWVDHAHDLHWMAPHGHPGVQVWPWPVDQAQAWPSQPPPETVALNAVHPSPTPRQGPARQVTSPPALHGVIEAFGCELPHPVQAALAAESPAPVWINLEYLSAEHHVERLHGLPSPVLSGPARGLQKWFFYPGFTAQTGGLLHPMPPRGHAAQHPDHAATPNLRVLLFCYEPASLDTWLTAWADGPRPVELSVCAGRASRAVRAWQDQRASAGDGALRITHLPWVSQVAFDALLAQHDLNLVRGEDSWVRAIWAGQALVWQIYPQSDGVHHTKLGAFLRRFNAPADLVQAHQAWNADSAQAPPSLTVPQLQAWREWVRAVRQGLLTQADLAQQLTEFAIAKGAPPSPQG